MEELELLSVVVVVVVVVVLAEEDPDEEDAPVVPSEMLDVFGRRGQRSEGVVRARLVLVARAFGGLGDGGVGVGGWLVDRQRWALGAGGTMPRPAPPRRAGTDPPDPPPASTT